MNPPSDHMWEHDLITAGAPATVGVAGILGTFFAPTWTQRKMAQRRERRTFRQVSRLVLDELDSLEMHFRLLVENGNAAGSGPPSCLCYRFEAKARLIVRRLTRP